MVQKRNTLFPENQTFDETKARQEVQKEQSLEREIAEIWGIQGYGIPKGEM